MSMRSESTRAFGQPRETKPTLLLDDMWGQTCVNTERPDYSQFRGELACGNPL